MESLGVFRFYRIMVLFAVYIMILFSMISFLWGLYFFFCSAGFFVEVFFGFGCFIV